MFEIFCVFFNFYFFFFFFFFNDTATTEIYTLSLHDALPIFIPAFGPRTKKRIGCSNVALDLAGFLEGGDDDADDHLTAAPLAAAVQLAQPRRRRNRIGV